MTSRYKLRATIIFFVFGMLYAIIAINLYLIQITHHDFYTNLAYQQYNVTITKTPPRAPIFDRTGKHYLAMNKNCVSAFVLPTQLTSPETLEPFLHHHFPQALKRLHVNRNKHFMFIKRKLTPEQQQLIEQNNIADIKLLSEPSRFYPMQSTGPIIGLTNIDNNGLFGIELRYNSLLAGTPTTCRLEKDARSGYFYFKKETTVVGHNSTPIKLTIDANLQFLAQEALKNTIAKFEAKEGAIIIMNPENGEILAMTCVPCFDPNNTHHLNIDHTKNRIIANAYELGSVIKVFGALAALEEGVVTPDELIDCKNKKTAYVDGRKVNTWHAHGVIPFTDVIALSNNIGIATVAKRIGLPLYDHYIRMGFGSKTGLSLPGEHKGFVNPPYNWSKQSIISLSYGYEISATILQLATAFCMIANNGYKVVPKLILSPETSSIFPDQTQLDKQVKLYSDENIKTIKYILEQTTLRGTTHRAQIKGYRIMSKTGTANILIDGKYNPQENIYTVAGIVQKDDYQRVIVTFIKQAAQKNAFASTVAAPLFETIAKHMLIGERIISYSA